MKYELVAEKPLQLLGNSFRIYFDNFIPLILISLITSIPVIIYQYKYSYIVFNYIMNPTESSLILYSSYLMTIISISVVVTAISTGLIVPIVSKKYISKKMMFNWYLNDILPRIVPLIVLSILSTLLSTAGFFLLFIPGIIIALGFSLSNEVFMIEKKNITESLKRSWELTAGKKLYIFGIIILLGIMTMIPELGISKVFEMFFIDSEADTMSKFAIVALIEGILSAVFRPVITCGIILVYFNILIEKENFGIEKLSAYYSEENEPSEDN